MKIGYAHTLYRERKLSVAAIAPTLILCALRVRRRNHAARA